jgi:fermentation-respiration switch protein FrsA (DUF1100 family)
VIRAAASAICVLTSGCLSLDGLWFPGEAIDAYTFPGNEIPETHIELVELQPAQVDGEDEAPTVWAAWAHQCLSDDASTCADVDHPEFRPERRDFTILYFHGYSSNLDGYWDRVQLLWRMGYRVLAVDYRGYGMSTGETSEDGLYADAEATLAHAKQRIAAETPGVDPENLPQSAALKVLYYGFSLGGAAAIDLAAKDTPAALVTEAANAGTQAFLDDAIGLGVSSSIVMDTEFDNLAKIALVGAPKLLTHGTADSFVKFEFSQALYDAAPEPKQLYAVAGAEHGNVPCPDRDTSIPAEDDNPCIASPDWLETAGGWLDERLIP